MKRKINLDRQEQKCNFCGEWKSFNKFTSNKNKYYGIEVKCKKCRNNGVVIRKNNSREYNVEKQIQKCIVCNEWKSFSDFHKLKNSVLGIRGKCKECRKSENGNRKDYYKERYKKNRKEVLAYTKGRYKDPEIKNKVLNYQKKRRDERRDIVHNFKHGKKCKCGFDYWQILEFHHKNKSDKIDKIANIMNRGTIKALREEMDKCILICPNCHRKFHSEEIVIKENVCQITKYRREHKKWFNNIKSKVGCKYCGERDPSILDCHHIDETKEHNLHKMVHERMSKNKILDELSKCVVLCANCHRKEHNNENEFL